LAQYYETAGYHEGSQRTNSTYKLHILLAAVASTKGLAVATYLA